MFFISPKLNQLLDLAASSPTTEPQLSEKVETEHFLNILSWGFFKFKVFWGAFTLFSQRLAWAGTTAVVAHWDSVCDTELYKIDWLEMFAVKDQHFSCSKIRIQRDFLYLRLCSPPLEISTKNYGNTGLS